MAISLETAKGLQRGEYLHLNASCKRWRVNGKVQTWKRDESRIRVPIKHGLYGYDALTESELNLVHLESECTVVTKYFMGTPVTRRSNGR